MPIKSVLFEKITFFVGKSRRKMAEKKKKTGKGGKFSIRRIISPAFLVVLLISFSMWFLTKLSHDYTAEIPVRVEVDGAKFRVTCTARGSGYRILSNRMFSKSKLSLKTNDIALSPSPGNYGYYVISPTSLLHAINMSKSDLDILSVDDIPEIRLNGQSQ